MRYSGKLGVVEQTETRPGVWTETAVEKSVQGTVKQRTEAFQSSNSVHPEYRTTTSISIFALANHAIDNSKIRYITYAGRKWTISSIVHEPPRIVLFIGEEYHDG